MLRLRDLTQDEQHELYRLKASQEREVCQRVRIVELASQGQNANEIATTVALSPSSVRRWIRRFNSKGFKDLQLRRSPGRRPRIAPEARQGIVALLENSPRAYGIQQDQWSLRTLARAAVAADIVDAISHEHVRRTLRDAGIQLASTEPNGIDTC